MQLKLLIERLLQNISHDRLTYFKYKPILINHTESYCFRNGYCIWEQQIDFSAYMLDRSAYAVLQKQGELLII